MVTPTHIEVWYARTSRDIADAVTVLLVQPMDLITSRSHDCNVQNLVRDKCPELESRIIQHCAPNKVEVLEGGSGPSKDADAQSLGSAFQV